MASSTESESHTETVDLSLPDSDLWVQLPRRFRTAYGAAGGPWPDDAILAYMFEDASELAADMSSFVPLSMTVAGQSKFSRPDSRELCPARSGETSVVAHSTQLGRRSHWPRSSRPRIPVRLPVCKTHCPGLSSTRGLVKVKSARLGRREQPASSRTLSWGCLAQQSRRQSCIGGVHILWRSLLKQTHLWFGKPSWPRAQRQPWLRHLEACTRPPYPSECVNVESCESFPWDSVLARGRNILAWCWTTCKIVLPSHVAAVFPMPFSKLCLSWRGRVALQQTSAWLICQF